MIGKLAAPIASRYVSVAIQLGIVTAIARLLPLDTAGRYFIFASIVFATYFAAGFGLPDGLVRFVPALTALGESERALSLARRAFAWSVLSALGMGVLVCAAILQITGDLTSAVAVAVWWSAYGLIFVSGQLLVARGRGELGTAVFYLFANLSNACLVLPALFLGVANDLPSLLIATAVATSVAAIASLGLGLWSLQGTSVHAVGDFRPVTKQGALVFIGRIVQSSLLWSPVWAAGWVVGSDAAALFGVATRVVAAVAAVIAAIRFSIRADLSHAAARGEWPEIEKQSSWIASFATSLALAAILATVVLGPYLIPLAFGAPYIMAVPLVALLLIGTVGESIGGPADEVLRMTGDARFVLVVQGVVTTACVALEFALGSVLGSVGICIAYGVAFVLMYAVFIVRLRRRRGITIVAFKRVAGYRS